MYTLSTMPTWRRHRQYTCCTRYKVVCGCVHTGSPQRVNGKVSGVVNGVSIDSANLHVYVVTVDGRAFTAMSIIPRSIGIAMLTTFPIGGIMGWLFAKVDSAGARNGFMITGEARREFSARSWLLSMDHMCCSVCTNLFCKSSLLLGMFLSQTCFSKVSFLVFFPLYLGRACMRACVPDYGCLGVYNFIIVVTSFICHCRENNSHLLLNGFSARRHLQPNCRDHIPGGRREHHREPAGRQGQYRHAHDDVRQRQHPEHCANCRGRREGLRRTIPPGGAR